jgi:diguanylate cyclase (GGDEF)-like protein
VVEDGRQRRSSQSDQAEDARAGSEVDPVPVAADQTVSELDQTASDADQAGSESDQTASDRDRDSAVADQRTSNRDQAAADRERETHPSAEAVQRYEASRADRSEGTRERFETAQARAQTAVERVDHAVLRDQSADLRDVGADARDRAAEQRDVAAAGLDRGRDLPRAAAELARDRAADLRALAAADRAAAMADRAAAARDRQQAREELVRAQLDPLTGAFGRALGMVALEREINRARHGNGSLVLVFVDVDELKQLNDSHGHAAGDALLREVVNAIQLHLRSYDPIVRVGGDEFVCALGDCTPDDARRRFRDIQATIEQNHSAASISAGFAALRSEDTLEQLTLRGDVALYEAKRNR